MKKTSFGVIWIAWVLVVLLGLLSGPQPILAAMSDAAALKKAKDTWGTFGFIGMERDTKQSVWTKFVGFKSPGCKADVTRIGIGQNTWDAAYVAMPADMGIGGTFGGTTTLKIDSPAAPGPPPPVTSDPIPGIVQSIRIMIDNTVIGMTVPDGTPTSWTASLTWDTSMVPDGFHVICAMLVHPDGSFALTHASLLNIKQPPAGTTPQVAALRFKLDQTEAYEAQFIQPRPSPIIFGVNSGPRPSLVQPATPQPPLPNTVSMPMTAWPPTP